MEKKKKNEEKKKIRKMKKKRKKKKKNNGVKGTKTAENSGALMKEVGKTRKLQKWNVLTSDG